MKKSILGSLRFDFSLIVLVGYIPLQLLALVNCSFQIRLTAVRFQ